MCKNLIRRWPSLFFSWKFLKFSIFIIKVESSQVLNFLLPTLFMARWLYSLCMRSVHDCWLPIVDIDKSAPLIYAPSYSSLFNSRACGGAAVSICLHAFNAPFHSAYSFTTLVFISMIEICITMCSNTKRPKSGLPKVWAWNWSSKDAVSQINWHIISSLCHWDRY